MRSDRNQNKANRSINLPKISSFLADHHCARVHSPISYGRDVDADESCRFLSIFWRNFDDRRPLACMLSASAASGQCCRPAAARRQPSRGREGRRQICASRHYSASVDSPLTEVLFLQVFFACAHKSKLSVTQNLIFVCFDEITI
jgi:hypothetical protein